MYDGKYSGLYEFIKNTDSQIDRFTLTFRQIEQILQFKLPDSSYKYAAWWSNEQEGTHTHSRSWRSAGWKTVDVHVGDKVSFVRERESE